MKKLLSGVGVAAVLAVGGSIPAWADSHGQDETSPRASQSVMSTKARGGDYGLVPVAATTQAPRGLANTCRPGSFASVMAAKLSPSARPGSPDLYKDCP